MSWWVNDYIAVSEDETKQLCNIQADAVSDLPAQDQTATAGFSFVRGSKAYVLDTSGQYIMNSSGQWILQKSGQEIEIGADDIVYDNTDSGLTATNVQDAIDELKDTDETQDNALVELYGENDNQQLEIDYAINTGSKNLFPNTAVSQTVGGVTFTVNDDGTITANGTKTNNDWFILSENNSFDANTYTLSDGLPNDTTDCQLIVATARSMSAAIMATAVNSRPQTKTFTTPQAGLYYAIRIASGKTVNNLTFKPMIRRAEITDSTYEPYAPTNRELYEAKTEQTETNVIANLGAKNMLKVTASSGSLNTATIDVADDGSIHIIGQPTGNGAYVISSGINLVIPENAYILSMGAEAGNTKMALSLRRKGTTQYVDLYYAESRIIPSGTYDRAHIYLYSDTTYDTTVYPMIRRKEITDNTFKPYAPTNRELYEMILALQSGGSVQSVNSLSTLNLGRNDLNKSLDSNFDLLDSIPEEEEGELE